MRAYYFDNLPGDQRLPHDSARPVSLDALKSLNLLYMNVPVDGYEERIATVAKEGDYKNHDIISISKDGLGDVGSSHYRGISVVSLNPVLAIQFQD